MEYVWSLEAAESQEMDSPDSLYRGTQPCLLTFWHRENYARLLTYRIVR
jgi:hypothetical protein